MGNKITRDSLWGQCEEIRRDLNQGSIHKMALDYQKHLHEMQNLPLNIAVTGQAGAGKSSFVNAIRGVRDDDDGAAKIGTVEQTMEPEAYPHPVFPNIIIWDLPGIGTSRFKAEEYLQKVQFQRYDAFIIVMSLRVTENDALLAKEVQRMRKKFYCVCTKIDANINSEKRESNLMKEKTLATIREYCEENLIRAGGLSARVFLISNWKTDEYDFPLLQETMAAELPYYKKHISTTAAQTFSENELRRKKAEIISHIKKITWTKQTATMGNEITKDFLRREFEELKNDLNQGNIPKVAKEYKERLNEMEKLPLTIAITGQTGSGKSSFVNAFRGINDDDDEAAKVGPVEETKEPKAYPHPSFPNIILWDLPGIGTPQFQAEEYLKKVQLERYNVIIIVTSDHFTENDALLAKEIQRGGKKFYYVRTKIDACIQSERRKKTFALKKTLKTVRNYCEDNLKKAAELSARIFLISNHHAHMYDFPLLQETIATELPDYQKHVLTLAVHLFSEKELIKKKELMKVYIKKIAWISCACGAVPVPGLSMVCDVGILVHALKRFCCVFGLDDRFLRFLALQTGKGFEELRSAIKKTPLANTINAELVFSLLMKSSLWVAVTFVELAVDIIPVLGSLFGGASSYLVTYHFLKSFLDDAVEDAQNVLAKLLEQPES